MSDPTAITVVEGEDGFHVSHQEILVFNNDNFMVQRRDDGLVEISETALNNYAFNPEYIENLMFVPSEYREDQAFGDLKFNRRNENCDMLWDVSLSCGREEAKEIAKVFGKDLLEYWWNKDGRLTMEREKADA